MKKKNNKNLHLFTVAEYTIKDTKKNAEDACDGYEASASAGGATATVSCELD